MDDSTIAAGVFFVIAAINAEEKKKKIAKRMWLRKLFRKRTKNSILNILDSEHFKNFTRMSMQDFQFLIDLIGPKIRRQDTCFRQAITVKERLAITLRFLATGDSYTSLQYIFKVSKQRIRVIVLETCTALIEALKDNIQVTTRGDQKVSGLPS